MNTSPILIGKVFGNLTVLERLPAWKDRTMWLTRCVCGVLRDVSTYELQSGRIRHCRHCQQADAARKRANKPSHGGGAATVDPEFDQ